MPPVNPLVVLVLLSFVPSRERFPAHSQRCNDEKGQARHQASHPCTQLEKPHGAPRVRADDYLTGRLLDGSRMPAGYFAGQPAWNFRGSIEPTARSTRQSHHVLWTAAMMAESVAGSAEAVWLTCVRQSGQCPSCSQSGQLLHRPLLPHPRRSLTPGGPSSAVGAATARRVVAAACVVAERCRVATARLRSSRRPAFG